MQSTVFGCEVMQHSYMFRSGQFELRPLYEGDIEKLRIWRNNTQLNRYITPIAPITYEMQRAWYEDYCKSDDELIFAICFSGSLSGSVSLYHIADDTAEFGRLMVGENRGCGLGKFATKACARIAFESLRLNALSACVTVKNISALRIYVDVGFVIDGVRFNSQLGQDEYIISLSKERFLALNCAC